VHADDNVQVIVVCVGALGAMVDGGGVEGMMRRGRFESGNKGDDRGKSLVYVHCSSCPSLIVEYSAVLVCVHMKMAGAFMPHGQNYIACTCACH